MEDKIVSEMVELYDAKAVILCGSRVVGDFFKGSDWDVFVFTPLLKDGETGCVKHRSIFEKCGFPSSEIDVRFLPFGVEFSYGVFNKKLRYAKVLFDTDGFAKELLETAHRFYERGPKKREKHHVEVLRLRSLQYLKKMEHLVAAGKNGELFLRLGWYVTEIVLPQWFDGQGEWELRPQQEFEYIASKDADFGALLDVVVGEGKYSAKVKACREIHKKLFK